MQLALGAESTANNNDIHTPQSKIFKDDSMSIYEGSVWRVS
jgi:hypothetical protein